MMNDSLAAPRATHVVFNQTPPLVEYNLYTTDRALAAAVERHGAGWAEPRLAAIGADLGSPDNFERARLANTFGPVLKTFDARGVRVDRVEFHPAWHELLAGITARGFHSGPWADPQPGGHVARAAGYLMQAQIEQGTLCPTTMTYGSVAALARDPHIRAEWLPRVFAARHDPRDLPIAQKDAAMVGMGMTEKQGGSDVRANTTRAERQPDGSYRITGHKWFFSAPQCDAHLVLAHTEDGLSCLFVPRFCPDGTKNSVLIQRLKDKVGNRSNASSEVEFVDAYGTLLGEPGRGIPTILEMGTFTRLDCVIGTAGMMRQAVVQAIHHARHRQTFGRLLAEQPLMEHLLADLVLESEGATALALRLARAFDQDDEHETLVRRVLTPASKFWVCKRGCELGAEAMEVLGGNGYVEEGPLGRLFREMPVNSIWEGSGNIMCLDVLRALSRSPAAGEVLLADLERSRGHDRHLDAALDQLAGWLRPQAVAEADARALAARLAVVTQAALLYETRPACVAAAFSATRLAPQWGGVFGQGALPGPAGPLLAEAWPAD